MTDHATDHFSRHHYTAEHVAGPVAFLNPTTRLHTLPQSSSSSSDKTNEAHHDVYHLWRSRDNRKGRHQALLPSPTTTTSTTTAPPATNTLNGLFKGLARMVIRYPIWDVSYDVATIFTLGSVVWVINGFFVLLPSTFTGESSWGGGVTAVVGATIFELGSVLLMLEAVNENRTACFGWAVEQIEERALLGVVPREEQCRHHHGDRKGFVKTTPQVVQTGEKQTGSDDEEQQQQQQQERKWTWWPSWYELRTHYFREIGFLACLSQMIGATVFWISGFTGLPPILNALSPAAEDGIYWLPQVVGGIGFIVSSWLFMLETQKNWYTPAPTVLGWHIGFWNLVGALGFTLCGALGFAAGDNSACEIGSLWATFIGSWAFLVSWPCFSSYRHPAFFFPELRSNRA